MRLITIGDIHGCSDKLKSLLNIIRPDRGDKLIFLGDYIDRGPDSRGVIDTILEIQKQNIEVVCLMGNHERLLLRYATSCDECLIPYLRQYGVETTLKSYGYNDLSSVPDLAFMPEEHSNFLHTLKICHEEKDFFFSHAGINPEKPLNNQTEEDLVESRMFFINAKLSIKKTVVFGHTIFDMPLVMVDKIGIDTGAAYGNLLTAVILPEVTFYHA